MDQGQEISQEARCEIHYTFINFIPMINKIKIDLLMDRKPSPMKYTQYLDLIKQKPEEFDNIDDLFLADLFSNQESDREFFNHKSIQKIIDRQF